ncbi:MAG: PilW family protein [Proteobacteria bacterium]|nr:PilW family protein [Pseudomonadota bacterium]
MLSTSSRKMRGFSLIELMIALVLGLVVVAAAIAVFLSSKDSYRTNLALGQVQENARIAFELLARDLRQAGITGCGNFGRVANVLNNGTNAAGTVDWYADFGNAVRGYDGGTTDPSVTSGTASAQRVEASSSITLIGAAMASVSVAAYNSGSYGFTLTGTNPGIQAGDLVIVCDPDHAVMAQVTSITGGALVVNTGTTTPGNCSRGLGFPTQCTTSGNSYSFGVNSLLSAVSAADWYIGNNPLGGRSLYRRTAVTTAGNPTPTSQEMVRNVTDLQISYHVTGATGFVTAASVAAASNWLNVDAVRIVLTLQGSEQATGTNGQPITRQLSATVNLRNRT